MNLFKNNALFCILIIAVLTAGSVLLVVSQKVYEAERSVKMMSENALSGAWEIRALKAELAYLTRPDRLDQISSAIIQPTSTAAQDNYIVSPVSFSFTKDTKPAAIMPLRKPAIYRIASPEKVKKSNQQDFSAMLNVIGGGE